VMLRCHQNTNLEHVLSAELIALFLCHLVNDAVFPSPDRVPHIDELQISFWYCFHSITALVGREMPR